MWSIIVTALYLISVVISQTAYPPQIELAAVFRDFDLTHPDFGCCVGGLEKGTLSLLFESGL